MTLSATVPGKSEKQVLRLFENLLATLPPHCVRIESRTLKKRFTEIALLPANERCAEFGVMFCDGYIYAVLFASGDLSTVYECPFAIKLTPSDGLDEHLAVIERMCLAVIAGRCEHHYKRLGLQGVILVSDSEVYRMTDVGLSRLFSSRHTLHVVKYEPYQEEDQN